MTSGNLFKLLVCEDIMAGKFMVAVGGVIETSSGQILVMWRSEENDFSGGVWEYPMGRLEQGEDCATGLLREVHEETGLDVEIVKVIDVAHLHRGEKVPENEVIGVLFGCKYLGEKEVVISSEHTKYEWVDVSEAIERMPIEQMKEVIKKFVVEKEKLVK